MSTVTVMTAERMQEIEDQAVVGGAVVGDNLILERHNGATFDAGVVKGADGTSISIVAKRVVVAASDANQETIDAAQFVCDGTDDQEEIMAAYLSLEGSEYGTRGEIVLSEGTFNIDLTIAPTMTFDHITLRGMGIEGTTVSVVHEDTLAMSFSYCQIRDIYFQEDDYSAVVGTRTFLDVDGDSLIERVVVEGGETSFGVITNDRRIVVRDSYLSTRAEGVAVFVNNGGQFENCTIVPGLDCEGARTYSEFDSGEPGYTTRFSNCRFTAGPDGTPHSYIRMWGVADEYDAESNCLIDTCQFKLISTTIAIAAIGPTGDRQRFKIVNCMFEDGGRTAVAIYLDVCTGVWIEGNHFDSGLTALSLSNSDGLTIRGNLFNAVINNVSASNCERIVVENNILHGKIDPTDFSTAYSGQYGFDIQFSDEVRIVGNKFELISQACILLLTCNRAYVANNDMWRCGRQTDNTYSGIKLTTSDDASILNNQATSSGDTVKLKYALEILAGCDRTYVHGNHFYDAADTAAILDSGTSTDTTSDNKVS